MPALSGVNFVALPILVRLGVTHVARASVPLVVATAGGEGGMTALPDEGGGRKLREAVFGRLPWCVPEGFSRGG